MAEIPEIPIPTGGNPVAALVAWAKDNPQAATNLIATINKLKNLEIVATIDGVQVRCPIQWAGENAVIAIPIS